MICQNCGNEIPDGAKFCPKCGTGVNDSKSKRSRECSREKNYRRGAQFHVRVSNARLLKIPGKLAWIAAAVTVVCMVVWNCLTLGSPQVVPSILMFFVLVIVFQILSRIVFLILDLASRRAYNQYIMGGEGNEDAGTERGRNGYAGGGSYYYGYRQSNGQSGGADSYASGEERSDYSNGYGYQGSTSGHYISLEEAKAMFRLKEPFTIKDLKKARNVMIMKGKIHPDDGGDPEKFKELMRAYDLLAEYIGG